LSVFLSSSAMLVVPFESKSVASSSPQGSMSVKEGGKGMREGKGREGKGWEGKRSEAKGSEGKRREAGGSDAVIFLVTSWSLAGNWYCRYVDGQPRTGSAGRCVSSSLGGQLAFQAGARNIPGQCHALRQENPEVHLANSLDSASLDHIPYHYLNVAAMLVSAGTFLGLAFLQYTSHKTSC
jgi:hypothetical protein